MLYDPKWRQAPTLKGFIAWLETQDPDEHYNWTNGRACPAARYCEFLTGNPYGWSLDMRYHTLSMIAGGKDVWNTAAWTYGQCLERAKACI